MTMEIGFLTSPFGKDAKFKDIVEWAGKAGFKALEVAAGPGGHLAPDDVLKNDGTKVRKMLSDAGVRVSGLAYYERDSNPAYVPHMKNLIAMAEVLGACVCTFAGFPAQGKSKLQTIREDMPKIFDPLAKDAEKRGVKIAFENWFATNLQHLDCFKAVTEALPQSNIGFNFDPSHLVWQEIDHLAAVEEFKTRIFHTHAKDAAISQAKLQRIGVLEGGWWQYVIPGYGILDWGQYIRKLREVGYDGVLSIEHEDRAYGAKEGFEKGYRHLALFA
jgi:sugar phosphate isomerase/epimerase